MSDEKKSNAEQREIWSGTFGNDYINRNQSFQQVDESYEKETGTTIQNVFEDFFSTIPKNYSILELGCNIGKNIPILNKMGFKDITGVEINKKASDIVQTNNPDAKIINSSIEEFDNSNGYDVAFLLQK